MKKLLFFSVIILIFLSSCNVKFVPAKSPEALTLIQTIYVDVSVLYNQISAAQTRTFVTFDKNYNDASLAIDSLITLDKSRSKSDKLVTQDLLIQTLFKKYKDYHSNKNTLSDGDIQVFKSYMKSAIKPRLTSEFQTL